MSNADIKQDTVGPRGGQRGLEPECTRASYFCFRPLGHLGLGLKGNGISGSRHPPGVPLGYITGCGFLWLHAEVCFGV
ncbi:hypothetical protein [Saguinine gammaherpesvirus 1]|uniref:Uncharacterized protein n=1 Tax=Saguinine gammaherpesvirus 1 TaxID=2169901 RepID=A0A9Q8QTE4_9GAMA|nr:hypothetical protein [Saguinine gammaherpesvirus 1]